MSHDYELFLQQLIKRCRMRICPTGFLTWHYEIFSCHLALGSYARIDKKYDELYALLDTNKVLYSTQKRKSKAITRASTENIVVVSTYQRADSVSVGSPIVNSAAVITSSLHSRLHVWLEMASGLQALQSNKSRFACYTPRQ